MNAPNWLEGNGERYEGKVFWEPVVVALHSKHVWQMLGVFNQGSIMNTALMVVYLTPELQFLNTI